MSEYTYDIVLQTQLGEKIGKLTLSFEENVIRGICSILGHSNPCTGSIDQQGKCKLYGQIRTFMSLISFSGTGSADSKGVNFSLSDGKNRFYMIGTVCKESELS